MGDRKVYDQKLHDQVSEAEGKRIKEIFRKTSLSVVEHPFGIYDIDIGLKLNGKGVGLIEVENRQGSWERGDFPHLSISLLERKYRYVESKKKYPVFYLGFRSDMQDCYVFSAWALKTYSNKTKISHRKNGIGAELENEYRYTIPVEHAVWGIDNCVSYMCGAVESYLNFK